MKRLVIAWVLIVAAQHLAQADDPSLQPYINELKKGMEAAPDGFVPTAEAPQPYIDSIKKKLPPASAEAQDGSFTENVKKSLPEESSQGSYTELQRVKLTPQETGGAISAVLAGKSELTAKRGDGSIHNAFNFQVGTGFNRTISGSPDVVANGFSDVYTVNWPEIRFQYERQPFHSEWFGNIGIVGTFGMGYSSGFGSFTNKTLTDPSGRAFSGTSHTKFQFFTFPFTIGANYRFNLLRVVRPYAMIGHTFTTYIEARNDRGGLGSWNRGISRGILVSGGVSFLLDWLSTESSQNLWTDLSVQHYYLTIDYTRLTHYAGAIEFASSGVAAGLTFEF